MQLPYRVENIMVVSNIHTGISDLSLVDKAIREYWGL